MNCSRCNTKVPQGRIDMGYTICVKCSTEDKVSCHTIYPHKTGGYIQVVSKEQSKNLNRLDRLHTRTLYKWLTSIMMNGVMNLH
jgi:hypothetical protein